MTIGYLHFFFPVSFWTQTQNSIANGETMHSKVRGPTKGAPLPQEIITSRRLILSPNISAVSRHGVGSTPCEKATNKLPLFSLVSMLTMQPKHAASDEWLVHR